MELYDRSLRTGYIYDPVVKQYDEEHFKTTSGTPAMSSTVLRFTSAAAATYIQHLFSDIEFKLTIPVAPTTSQAKIFGFKNPAGTDLGAAYFEITGATFRAVTYDSYGTAQTTTITWDADWTATAVKYRIVWDIDIVRFFVDGSEVATHTTRIPQVASAVALSNGNADNMDLTYYASRAAADIV